MVNEHPLPGNQTASIDFGAAQYGEAEVIKVGPIEESNALLSRMDLPPGVAEHHRPVIDIDLPAKLIPSSTPGHFHLLIDKPMPWHQYLALLEALVAAGIVEEGYMLAAKRRKYSAIRLPGVPK